MTMAKTKKRRRACKNCGKFFRPDDGRKIEQRCPFCGQITAKRQNISTLKAKAWRIFSEYIRRRDADPQGYCRCVTCGVRAQWHQLQAGHFLRSRSKGILFDERGVHAQCDRCNRLEGHGDDYWVFMETRYGRDVIEELRELKWQGGSWTQDELKAVIKHFEKKLQELWK